MIWKIDYKIKGDTKIQQEEVDLQIESKWDVIDWWKENKNSKKDKEIVNCSNGGTLNVKGEDDKEHFIVQMILRRGDITVSSSLTSEQIKIFEKLNFSGFENTYKILQSEYNEIKNKK